jgi:hypothetical protein
VRHDHSRLAHLDRESLGLGGYDAWFLSFHAFFGVQPLPIVNSSVGRKSIGAVTPQRRRV